MDMRRVAWILMAGLMTASVASAEQGLWISYYTAGLDNLTTGEYLDAGKLLETAGPELNTGDPDEAHRVGGSLDKLGMTYLALDDFEGAERCLTSALSIKEKALGLESVFLPPTLNNLGDLYYVCGEKDQCEPLYRRVIAILEKDTANVEACRALNGLALLEADKGEKLKAEELLKRAIRLHGDIRRLHPYCATCHVNLAVLYLRMDRLDDAADHLQEARYIHKKSIGDNHPDAAVRLSAQAALAAKKGKADKAAEFEQQAQAIRAAFAAKNKTAPLPEAVAAAQETPVDADAPMAPMEDIAPAPATAGAPS